MTPDAFRRLALRFPGAAEHEHMGHPDFRTPANGKAKPRIFASLFGGDDGQARGMIRLTPEDQEALIAAHPDTFSACPGAWGRQGCTAVNLEHARTPTIRAALLRAWAAATSPQD